MQYDVEYPSGRTFALSGRFEVAKVGESGILVPAILDDHDQALVLDQRAIVRMSGRVVYTPRMWADGLTPEAMKWLIENEDWAQL